MKNSRQITPADVERFWSKVGNRKNEASCWPWLAYRKETGYGMFRAGKMWRSHRLAFELTNGPIPNGLSICHTCDNPACCNPSHLWAGTISQNIRDSFAKGRKDYRGEGCPRAKLSNSDVRAIRRSKAALAPLANKYGVSITTISGIRNRRIWKHLP